MKGSCSSVAAGTSLSAPMWPNEGFEAVEGNTGGGTTKDTAELCVQQTDFKSGTGLSPRKKAPRRRN